MVLNASGQPHRPLASLPENDTLDVTLLNASGEQSYGRAQAANQLLKSIIAPYALFLDDDDELYGEHLSKLYEALTNTPDAVAAYSDVLQTHSESKQTVLDAPWEPARLFAVNFLPIHAVLFRTQPVLEGPLSFDTGLALMEDWDFWIQLSQKGAFVHSPGVSAQYNVFQGQSTLSANREAETAAQAHTQILKKWLNVPSTQYKLSEGILWFDGNHLLMREKIHQLEHELTKQDALLKTATEDVRHYQSENDRLRYHKKILDWYLEHLPESCSPKQALTSNKERARAQVLPPLFSLKDTATMIDIIIPVYKGLEETQECISSVLKATNETAHRIILINDASPEPALTTWLRDIAKHPLIKLIENPENLGFTATVNKGMQLSNEHDVILLNSDTEVAHDWLDRLHTLAYQDSKIGTVTPFSNNATICSYPKFCEDNELPAGLGFAQLDQLFRDTLKPKTLDIPSAVGFCMYIKRDCLKQVGLFNVEVFGKGYGEENDFSQRAFKKGWKNVLGANIFVWHKGNVSFGDSHNERKENAMKALLSLHPDYNTLVHRHIQQDPALKWRWSVDWARWRQVPKNHVLFISHNRGGGTEKHCRELADALGPTHRFFMLRPDQGGQVLFEAFDRGEAFRLWFDPDADQTALLDLIKALDIQLLHFHHLIDINDGLLETLLDINLPKIFTAHDYYTFCPQITLTLPNHKYCGEKGPEQCKQCLGQTPGFKGVDIHHWRDRHQTFLNKMSLITCPNASVKRRLQHYFPDISISVHTHPDLGMTAANVVRMPALKASEPLRVAIVGAISPPKGAEILLDTVKAAQNHPTRIHFKLFGFVHKPIEDTPVFTHTGPYQNEALGQMLKDWDPHLVWYPSQFPETHCYTLSQVLAGGHPVVTTDVGAVAQRIQDRPFSWQLPVDLSPKDWCEWFLTIGDRLPTEAQHEEWTPESMPTLLSSPYYENLGEAAMPKLDGVEPWIPYAQKRVTYKDKLKELMLRIAYRARSAKLTGRVIALIPNSTQRRIKSWLMGHTK
ncbi:hypothetical protein AVO41_01255 [Thiomicrospira sp. WB1]|nr:hypothetical protein AVO41_01255 [Thiomicrospira sp. WB1]